jgi:hypothetical protein
VNELKLTSRLLIAIAIAGVIYGVAIGIGSILYATGTIATGATHADCGDHRDNVAKLYPELDEHDLPQAAIKEDAVKCLAANELSENEAFREEYLLGPIWPAVICAVIFLAWPAWSRILHNQEASEALTGEPMPKTH